MDRMVLGVLVVRQKIAGFEIMNVFPSRVQEQSRQMQTDRCRMNLTDFRTVSKMRIVIRLLMLCGMTHRV